MSRILIVEDEEAMRLGLVDNLKFDGHEVDIAEDGESGLDRISSNEYDLVLLDVMLPKMSGFDVCKTVRKEGNNTPIILLTARGEEIDKVLGLELGADDYITKPFSLRELLARIKAVLRRGNADIEGKGLTAGQLVLDRSAKKVQLAKEEINLGPLEFKLLEFFMLHPDRVYSREQLLDRVWGGNVYIEDRTVDVHIRRLRKSISRLNHDSMIQTVRGAGYRFSVEGLKEE